MRTILALVTVFSVSAPAPSISELGAAARARPSTMLTDSESNGPTRFGNDTAQLAEASMPSPGSRDAAL